MSELLDILIVCVIALAVMLPVLAVGGLNKIDDDANTKVELSADRAGIGNKFWFSPHTT